jgi:hypothetical protein
MTDTDDILKAAGWDEWTDEDGMQPWIYTADDKKTGWGLDDMRLLVVRRGKALAVTIGYSDTGPTIYVRAFDGVEPAIVGMSGFNGDMSLTVAEPKSEDDGLF